MPEDGRAGRARAAALAGAALLCAGGLAGWAVWTVRLQAEASVVAFGQVAPQLERLAFRLAMQVATGVLLLALTLRLGWLAWRESVSIRRAREARRIVED